MGEFSITLADPKSDLVGSITTAGKTFRTVLCLLLKEETGDENLGEAVEPRCFQLFINAQNKLIEDTKNCLHKKIFDKKFPWETLTESFELVALEKCELEKGQNCNNGRTFRPFGLSSFQSKTQSQ